MPDRFATGRFTSADPGRIRSRDDFADFMAAVLADFRASGADEWENGTLERFLDALQAFAQARVRHPQMDQERATWELFGELIAAATGYE